VEKPRPGALRRDPDDGLPLLEAFDGLGADPDLEVLCFRPIARERPRAERLVAPLGERAGGTALEELDTHAGEPPTGRADADFDRGARADRGQAGPDRDLGGGADPEGGHQHEEHDHECDEEAQNPDHDLQFDSPGEVGQNPMLTPTTPADAEADSGPLPLAGIGLAP